MMTATTQVKSRSEVSSDHLWNVSALFPNLQKWEEAFQKIKERNTAPFWPSFDKYKNRLHEGPQIVKEALEHLLKIGREVERLYTYAHLRHDEDITEDANKSAYQRACSLLQDFGQESAWFEPEILSLTAQQIDELSNSPILRPFRFHL